MPHTVITAIYQNVDQHLHPGAEMKNSHIKKRMSQLFRFLLPCSQHLLRLLPTPKNNISFCFYVPLSFSTMTSPLTRCQYWRWLWINRTATQSCRSAFLCFLSSCQHSLRKLRVWHSWPATVRWKACILLSPAHRW